MEKNKEETKQKIEKLKSKILECEKEKEEYKIGWQRERADFLNFKKRQEKEIEEKTLAEKEKIITLILPILDNLEKGLETKSSHDNFYKGIQLIYSQFRDILKKIGVQEIKTKKGDIFNPKIHNAVAIENAGNGEKGLVLEVMEKGYTIDSKVVRASRVKVSG